MLRLLWVARQSWLVRINGVLQQLGQAQPHLRCHTISTVLWLVAAPTQARATHSASIAPPKVGCRRVNATRVMVA